jgi:hypothetical protein
MLQLPVSIAPGLCELLYDAEAFIDVCSNIFYKSQLLVPLFAAEKRIQ